MIIEKIDKFLLEEQEKSSKRIRSGLWSPSSFGRCFRYQYWNRLNEPITNPVDAKTLRVFSIGKLFHNFFQNILKGEHQCEVMIKTEDSLGYADLVSIDEVADIKSVKSYSFKLMKDKKKKFDFRADKMPEILQTTFYGKNLNKPKGRIIFVEKNNMDVIEFTFDIAEFIPMLDKELEILNNFWNAKVLPPNNPRCYGGNECSYCGFQDKCITTEGR
jgi:hypothetical protein